MDTTAAQGHPTAFFVGLLFGALGVGVLAGLVPLIGGSVTGQKKIGISGFFTCLLGGLVGGAIVAIPLAIGFTLAAVLRAKEALDRETPGPPDGA